MADTERMLGRHEALIEQLAQDSAQMRADVRQILETLAERRGERRITLWLAGGAGAVASTIVGFVAKFFAWTAAAAAK